MYSEFKEMEMALFHYRESIRYNELAKHSYGAGITRRNLAIALMEAGRLYEAHDYAEAALRNFAAFGDRAADIIQRTQTLLDKITHAMQ